MSKKQLLQVPKTETEILLNTPKRNEILETGLPEHSHSGILGRGAYGTVFKAIFHAKRVAVKIVKNMRGINSEIIHNEMNILGWNQPNIIKILMVESTPKFGLIIMERLSGCCLQKILHATELTIEHQLFITMDILNALSFCHSHKLLHLDVKPPNILVSHCQNWRYFNTISLKLQSNINRNYLCKLCDFGTSHRLNDVIGDERYKSKGTLRYMSPEALCETCLTPAADIYSLGVTMWQIQHRKLPYYWIECNETVAYQVVKNNLRPTDSILNEQIQTNNTINIYTSEDKKNTYNCSCVSQNDDLTNDTINNIKSLLNTTIDKTKGNKTLKVKNKAVDRQPLREINQNILKNLKAKSKVKRNLYDELKENDVEKIKCQIEKRRLQMHADTFSGIYKSCWNKDATKRPTAKLLQNKINNILRNLR